MKHPHYAVDAVLDFEPESTGQPIVVGQPPPPIEEALHPTAVPLPPGPVDRAFAEPGGASVSS